MLTVLSPGQYDERPYLFPSRSNSPSLSSCTTISWCSEPDTSVEMEMPHEVDNVQQIMDPAATHTNCPQSLSTPGQPMLYGNPPENAGNSQNWLSVPMLKEQQLPYHSNLLPNGVYPVYHTDTYASTKTVVSPFSHTPEASPYSPFLPSQPQCTDSSSSRPHPIAFSGFASAQTLSSSSLSQPGSPASFNVSSAVPAKTLPSNASPQLVANSHVRAEGLTCFPPAQSGTDKDSLNAYGIPIPPISGSDQQAWRCAFPNCSSRAIFTRGCDLRKHYNRHSKHLFCRFRGCPQSAPSTSTPLSAASSSTPMVFSAENGQRPINAFAAPNGRTLNNGTGFSSKKDRARHEAKHNPRIMCEWINEDGTQCDRRFSRVDNMKDHVRRIHRKAVQRVQDASIAAGPDSQNKMESFDIRQFENKHKQL